MNSHQYNLFRDLAILTFSITLAIILVKTGTLINILSSSRELSLIGIFVAGFFFTSIFTTAPAIIALGELATFNPLLLVAVLGGLGALVGDLIIFKFVRDRLSEDLTFAVTRFTRKDRIKHLLKSRLFKWLTLSIGAVIIASPLPDELGISLMGLSKLKTTAFVPLSFVLNSIGIALVGLAARAITG